MDFGPGDQRDRVNVIRRGSKCIAASFRRITAALQRAFIRYYQMRILLSLDDRMLADLGLDRREVRALVRSAMRRTAIHRDNR